MIGYSFFRTREDASGILLLLPFLLVVAGALWVASERAPDALEALSSSASAAVSAYWDLWPAALVLLAGMDMRAF